jgi:hypothetical protein
MRHILLSRNNWWREGHEDGDPSRQGVDAHALTLITKLLRGAAAFLGVLAPVNGDPLVPMNAVGSIQAKV